MDRQGRRNKSSGKLWLKVNGLLYERPEKSLGTSLSWSYSSSDTEGETKAQLGGNYIPLWVRQLAHLNGWMLSPEGWGKSLFLKGHWGTYLSYFRPKRKLLRHSVQPCLGFITENNAFSHPVTPHRIECWRGRHTDLTGAKAGPQQIQHPKVPGKDLAQFQPSDDKWETEGCPNDISHPGDGGRVRAARAAERAQRCEWWHASSLKESNSWCTEADEEDIEARCSSHYLNNTGI